MKCPKCSYTSFDYLDACKRCGTDLRDTRTLLQIIAVSPEERAPSVPPAGRVAAEAAAPPPPDLPEFGAEPQLAEGSELLEGLDFEESFEGMVERTSYEEEKPAPPEDELLDLDFGDIFGEESKK
ncbi:MAG: hypothetical protein IH608_10955, partial [Proteobacteria bacterium]|nr:hypothetical protein [Pseudomonadota bacterium]